MTTLTIENAQINTAAIEIKTLTVKGKQITLSVFRQIIEENLICMDSFKLNGTPWGIINYYFGEHKDKSDKDYMHIVWQKGKELRRSVVPISVTYTKTYSIARSNLNEVRNLLSRYTAAEHFGYKHGEYSEFVKQNIHYLCQRSIESKNSYQKLSDEIAEHKDNDYWIEKNSWKISQAEKHKDTINELQVMIDESRNRISELKIELTNEENNLSNIMANYSDLITSLRELPQLFIAI